MQKVASMMGLMVYADYHWLNRVMGEQASVSEVRVTAMQRPWEKKQFLESIRTMPGLETVSDLGEQKDIAADHPEIVSRLLEEMAAFRQRK